MIEPLPCDAVEPWFDLYLDEQIVDEERKALELHLDMCPACRQKIGLLEKMKRGLAETAALNEEQLAPDSLISSVRTEAARCSSRAKIRFVWGAVPVGLAAAGFVMVVAGGAETQDQKLGHHLERAVMQAVAHHDMGVPLDVASPNPNRVAGFFKPRLQENVGIFALDAMGFSLRGGRLVAVDERQAVHLSYSGGLGRQVSVLAVPDGDGVLRAQLKEAIVDAAGESVSAVPKSVRLRGIVGNKAVEIWEAEQTVYTMVGEARGEALEKLAQFAVNAQLGQTTIKMEAVRASEPTVSAPIFRWNPSTKYGGQGAVVPVSAGY